MVSLKNILVTGGNTGIGYALCKQLAVDHGCHVFLAARNEQKGRTAVAQINDMKANSCDFIEMDTSVDASVIEAAATVKSKLAANKEQLYALVNNAGIGWSHDGQTILNTNLYGPKRVSEAFTSLLDPENGRIVNVGSGSGPNYVQSCNNQQLKRQLCDPTTVTWDFIDQHAKAFVGKSGNDYGLSKALLTCYTGLLAREHPNLKINCISPGFIDTQLTKGFGASKTPEEGTVAIQHCLFSELNGNGWYYGSDAVRSPLHYMRNPGEPPYDGIIPF